jgi:hypothetical protein
MYVFLVLVKNAGYLNYTSIIGNCKAKKEAFCGKNGIRWHGNRAWKQGFTRYSSRKGKFFLFFSQPCMHFALLRPI